MVEIRHQRTAVSKASAVIGTLLLGCSMGSQAAFVDFTGGTVYFNDGGTATTDASSSYQNVLRFEDQGFQMEFMFSSTPQPFASIVGDYYSTGNDVIHFHWEDDGQSNTTYGEVTELRISKIDGTSFDLGGFRVSTNTAIGGGSADGNEMVWVNTSKGSEIFTVEPDDWGLGAGTDPLITIDPSNALFDDILWFSFTNDALSSAVGLGLDNFYLDEPGEPGGVDPSDPSPSNVPVPGTLLLIGAALAFAGRRRRS